LLEQVEKFCNEKKNKDDNGENEGFSAIQFQEPAYIFNSPSGVQLKKGPGALST
jgi:hypothetical protein